MLFDLVEEKKRKKMNLNCAIIDDEPLAAQLLAGYAERTPFLNLVGVYNNAIDAMRALRSTNINLLFLDIQMPELSGIEFATILPPEVMVIFTTAFDRYAVDSFKVNTVDYLLKPISYETFVKAADKALKRHIDLTKAETYSRDRIIFVKSDYKLLRINLDDILYVEGVKEYVKIVIEGEGKPIMSLMNMKTIEEFLPSPEFLRVHRSFIVHMPKVNAIDRMRLVIGDNIISVSDTYKNAVQEYIDSHTLA